MIDRPAVGKTIYGYKYDQLGCFVMIKRLSTIRDADISCFA